MTKYKVIKLTKYSNTSSGFDTLVADLSEIELLGFTLPDSGTTPFTFNPEKVVRFILPQDLLVAENILAYPEEVIEMDLSDFKEGHDDEEEGRRIKVFIHKELIKSKLTNTNDPGDLNKITNECLLLHHVDMFFNFLFRYIIHIEYESKGQKYSASLQFVLDQYLKLSNLILDDTVKVNIPDINISEREKASLRLTYNQPLQQANSYKEMLSYYIVARKNVTERFKQATNESKFFVPLFAQLCMLEGFNIATKRIKDNLHSKIYFGHELTKHNNTSTLKLFMTPFGSLMKDELVEKAKAKSLDDELDNYLSKHKILRIKDETKIKELKTRYIFSLHTDGGMYYFKKRTNEERDSEASFEQDPTNPLRALVVQTQLNLTSVS